MSVKESPSDPSCNQQHLENATPSTLALLIQDMQHIIQQLEILEDSLLFDRKYRQ